MDWRSSRIALGAYLLIGCLCVAGLLAYIGHIQRNFTARIDQVEDEIRRSGPTGRRPPVLLQRLEPSADSTELSKEVDNIRELRRLLDQRTRQLEERSKELERTSEEYRRLGEENDHYLALLTELFVQDSSFDRREDRASREAMTESRESVSSDELDLLQWGLTEAQETISLLETAQLQQRELASGIETAIVEAGDVAVPLLLSVLTDQRADLRLWAATLLGRLGNQAADAADLLQITSTSDTDPNVRRAASWAVRQIDQPFD